MTSASTTMLIMYYEVGCATKARTLRWARLSAGPRTSLGCGSVTGPRRQHRPSDRTPTPPETVNVGTVQ
jgi:hypothetical protein